MSTRRLGILLVLFLVASGVGSTARADNFVLDPVHSGVNFKISHLGLSWIYGRFDDFSADFSIDPANPGAATFAMTIKADSIDTNNKKRDDHLRSPDFFNVKQYPLITFKSTSVQKATSGPGGLVVTGNFTMHGETKPITFTLYGGKTIDFKGVQRTGYTTELKIKRSDFGMKGFPDMLGDDVHISVSFEATKK
jgi:polyisoprenoid-binding protein YceI